jgi:acetyl esterase
MRLLFSLLWLLPVFASAIEPTSREPDAQWAYKTIDGKEFLMDVFLPAGYADADVSYPVMVIFHGGSWAGGETKWHWPDGNFWAKRGMVAVSVDYRLRHRDQVKVPLECVKDAKSAIRYLRANAKELKIDPSRVVAMGDSAGGHLAAATATLTDPKTNDDCFDLSISCVPQAVILTCPWFKTSPDMCPPKHLREGLPPFITFAGGADHAIPVSEMEEFHQALKARSIPSELYIGNQGKHGFCNGRNPYNRFFYWSINLADQFLVKHGILEGVSNMTIPKEVKQLKENDFQVYQ